MLHNALNDIPQIVLLRNDRLFLRLVDAVVADKHDDSHALFDGVRDFYPNTHRKDVLEHSIRQPLISASNPAENINELDLNYSCHFLEEWFERYFELKGTTISVKHAELERFTGLATKVEPMIIVAYRIAQWYRRGEIGLQDVRGLIESYSPLFYPKDRDATLTYAENHMHQGGIDYVPFTLMQVLGEPVRGEWNDPDYFRRLPRINEFSHINNGDLRIAQLIETARLALQCLMDSAARVSMSTDRFKEALKALYWDPFYPFGITGTSLIENTRLLQWDADSMLVGAPDPLIRVVYEFARQKDLHHSYFMLWVVGFLTFGHRQDTQSYVFKLLMQSVNILRSYMLMSQNVGLAHFSEFFGAPVRRRPESRILSMRHCIPAGGVKYLNVKKIIREGDPDPSHIAEAVKTIIAADVPGVEKINVCLCVSKQREPDRMSHRGAFSVEPQFARKRDALQQSAIAVDTFLRDNRHFKMTAQVDHPLLKPAASIPPAAPRVVAIDAVGKETHTPPEVFAAYMRFLRSGPKKMRFAMLIDGGTTAKPHHLTISAHAGEDFDHIVTGMRRVDETVRFWNMAYGDRLGHALSIGIDPKRWLDSTKDLAMLKGDYLDDLVWLCIELNHVAPHNRFAIPLIRKYEKVAITIASEIYGSGQFGIKDLYDAWELRRNCPIAFGKMLDGTLLHEEHYYHGAVPDYARLIARTAAAKLYFHYHTDPGVRRRRKAIISIKKYSDEPLSGRINEVNEYEVWEALQDHLMTQYSDKKGLIIEANPSSNLFIGPITTFGDHPIFRWHPPREAWLEKKERYNRHGIRKGIVKVCVNSDDPAIFVTTLQTEFWQLRRAAKHMGISEHAAKAWVEALRKFGIEVFEQSWIEEGRFHG